MTDRQSSLTNSQNRYLLLATIPSKTTFSIFFVTIIQQTTLCLDLIKSVFFELQSVFANVFGTRIAFCLNDYLQLITIETLKTSIFHHKAFIQTVTKTF